MATTINAGRVRFVSRGTYNNSTQYYLFDLVDYNGSSYIAKENTVGNLPTNNQYWQLIAEKGNTGSTGQTGPVGATGNGIASIKKTGTSGLVDTYTITYTNGNTTTFTITNGEDGEVTETELNVLREKVANQQKVINQLPQVTGQGTSITLENTIEAPFTEFEVKGHSEQDGEPTPENPVDIKSCGDNVNEFDKETLEQGSFVFTTGDNVASDIVVRSGLIEIKPNTSYIISANEILDECAVSFYNNNRQILSGLSSGGNYNKKDYTVTSPSNAYYIRFRIGNRNHPKTVENDYKIKLEKGTVATPYSPYGMGCMNEKIQSRNLFKPKEALVKIMSNFNSNNILIKNTSTDISISDDNYMHGKSSNYIGIVNKFNFIKGKTIYNKGYRGSRSVMVYNSNGTPVAILQPPTIQYTPSDTFEGYIGIGLDANDANADGKYIMFSYDENATYSQYQGEQNKSIPTQQPMMDDDYFDRENNEEVHTWQRIVLDGSSDEDWVLQNNSYFACTTSKEISGKFHNKWFAQVIGPNSLQYAKSNIGVIDYRILDWGTGFGLALTYGVRINLENIDASKGGTIEQLRAYLAENPITVYVKLKESAYEKLPFTQEQIQQLENLPSTYKDFTIIQSEDETPAYLEVSGIYDLNNLINN